MSDALKPDAIEEATTATARCWRWRKSGRRRGRRRARSLPRASRATMCRTGCAQTVPSEMRAPRAISPRSRSERRRPTARARARAHRAPAVAGAAGAAAGAPPRSGAADSRARQGSATPSATLPTRCWRCSTMRALPPLFAPGSRAEVPIVGISRRRSAGLRAGRSPRRSRQRRADRRLQIEPHRARAHRGFRRTTSRNWRSIARCCARSIRITRCAPRWSGPPGRRSRNCPTPRSMPQCQGLPHVKHRRVIAP